MTAIEKYDSSETIKPHTLDEVVKNIDNKNKNSKNSDLKEAWNYFRDTFYCFDPLSGKRCTNYKDGVVSFGVSMRKNETTIDLIITKNGIATVLEYIDGTPPVFFQRTYGTRKNLSGEREVDFSKTIGYPNIVNYKEVKEICLKFQNDISEYNRMVYENINQYNNYANNIKKSDERDAAELLKQV